LPREGCYFFLDKKVTKKSRQKKASTLPAGSYAFFVLRTLQKLNRHSRLPAGRQAIRPARFSVRPTLIFLF
jgi:hypothetical protein